MNIQKLRAPLLVGAIAAVAATAWANTSYEPVRTTVIQEPVIVAEPQSTSVSETLSANETIVNEVTFDVE